MLAKLLKIAGINLLLLLVVAVAAELTFGTWFSSDPLDRLSLPRDTATTVSAGSLYAGGGDVPYRRDHWGFRGQVDPAKVTVLTVGGSTTNQLYLPEDKTWQAVMEREFRAEGREVVIANAGVDGQSTVGHLQSLRDWFPHIPGLKPRFVLAYVGLNDVHVSGAWIDALQHPDPIRRARQHSAIIRMSRQIGGMITARRAKLNHQRIDYDQVQWTDKPAQPDWRPPENSTIGGYKQRLKDMARMIHEMGAVPIFVTQPRGDFRVVDGKVLGVATPEGLNGVDQHRLVAAYNDATRAVCREEGLLCLDLAREAAFDKGDFYDYLHNTPQGAEKIGRWLHAKLAGLV